MGYHGTIFYYLQEDNMGSNTSEFEQQIILQMPISLSMPSYVYICV